MFIFQLSARFFQRKNYNTLCTDSHVEVHMGIHAHTHAARLFRDASEPTHPSPHAQHTVSLTPLLVCLSYRCGCAAGSPACWQSRLPLAQPVCGWWHSALTAGWSPPGWRTEWPHQCAGPAACCHPSSSRFLPEEEREVQTRCHADKLTISCEGRCPQISPSSVPFLSSPR